jgi:hypothetical protein
MLLILLSCRYHQGQNATCDMNRYLPKNEQRKRRRRWRYNFNLVNHAAASCWLRHIYNFTVEYRDEFMSEEAINFAVFSSAEITATPPLSFCVTCRFSD